VKQPDRTMESVPRVAGFLAKDQPRLGATQAGAKAGSLGGGGMEWWVHIS
jgi:hypothetical protein